MNLFEFLGLDLNFERPLLCSVDGELSAQTMLLRAGQIAWRLKEHGATGQNVVISLDNSPAFFSSIVGAWAAGAVPVLLDPLVRRELHRAVVQTGAVVVLRDGEFSPWQEGLEKSVPVITPDDSESVVIASDVPMPVSDPIVYLFTSGSRGEPAIVAKTLEQLEVEIQFISRLFSCPRHVATMVPWCHIYGFLASFLVPLRCGGVLDISAGISPKALIEHIDADRLDLVVGVPAIYRVMNRLASNLNRQQNVHSCRFVSSGAPLTENTWSTFQTEFGAPITELYGSTEAGGVAYRHNTGPWVTEPHVQTRIDDDGQLLVKSPSVSAASNDDFFPMGDLVHPISGGFELQGRVDDVVKIGGRRVALGEIERVIDVHPGVKESAVVAAELRGQVRLVAYVSADRAALSQDDIRSHVRQQLADHKVPRVVHFVSALPRNPGGKVDRRRLTTVEARLHCDRTYSGGS